MNMMVICQPARPAIREGKAVMDAARNNFPNNDNIKGYLKDVYEQGDLEAIVVLEQASRKKDIDGILAVMAQHRDSSAEEWVLGPRGDGFI